MRTTTFLTSSALYIAAASAAHAQSVPPTTPTAADQKQQRAQTQPTATVAQTLNKLHELNLREIAAGKLAQERARTEPVENFGEKLVEHHTKNDLEVRALAKRMGVELAESKPDVGTLESAINPAIFDRQFANQMAKDHRALIALLEEAAHAKERHPELHALVQKTLPIAKRHNKIAVQLVQNNPF